MSALSQQLEPVPDGSARLDLQLRKEIAEHLAYIRMHADHGVDYAERGCDDLLAISCRHVGLYFQAAQASLADLRKAEKSTAASVEEWWAGVKRGSL